jgi:hypothetical protein
MSANRNYSSVARATTLTGSVNGSATVISVTETTGFPSAPFTLVIDPARTVEEAVTVTAVVGLNLTVVRGVDGTAASPHDAGATVRHMATARDFREPAEHINDTDGIHGIDGALLGVDDVQTVDNKTFVATGDHTSIKVKNAVVQTADLMQFQNSGGTAIASVKPSGRISTPGVDGSSSSTFTAGAAGTVPLVAKGAAAQTANLISARDAADIELMHVGFDGTLGARSTSVSGNLTVSAEADIADLITSHTATALTTDAGITPLVVQAASGQTAATLQVQTSAATPVAGVRGQTGSWQMFHGGSAGNVIPFKIHAGVDSVTIGAGASSQFGTIDLTPYGFDIGPVVCLTVRQKEASTTKRRVAVNMASIVTTTSVSYRVFQTQGDPLPDDETYSVHWIGIQMLPTVAIG